MRTRRPRKARRSTIAALVAGVAILASGCTETADPSGSSSGAAERATPRGLTAAVLRHLDATEDLTIGGSRQSGHIQTFLALDDDARTVVFVSAHPPSSSAPSPACGEDSGFAVVTCTESEGELLSISRGPAKSADGKTPLLLGRAYRADGSSLLIQIFATGAVEFPAAFAEEVLRDPLVGWTTTPAVNDEGERLADFHTHRVTSTGRFSRRLGGGDVAPRRHAVHE